MYTLPFSFTVLLHSCVYKVQWFAADYSTYIRYRTRTHARYMYTLPRLLPYRKCTILGGLSLLQWVYVLSLSLVSPNTCSVQCCLMSMCIECSSPEVQCSSTIPVLVQVHTPFDIGFANESFIHSSHLGS